MSRGIEEVLLRPGESAHFADRDDLLEKLDELNRRVPGRLKGRTKEHREHYCILRYLRFMAGAGELETPLILRKAPKNQDPPDYTLEWPDSRTTETFELTDGSTEAYQKALTEAERKSEGLVFPQGVESNTSEVDAAALWAEILFSAFLRKSLMLASGRFEVDHLLIYDLTGISLLLPLEGGAPLLREKIEQWVAAHRPRHRFSRLSVLRDQSMLFDLTGNACLLQAESPYFQIPVIRAAGEQHLKRRLRALDRYCRENSIRHLKLFGSVLGDLSYECDEGEVPGRMGADSDYDVLVEFEPGAVVTLLDMSRMERELADLLGFEVDLLTAEDLSRYFRQQVLDQAVEYRVHRV
ncbi:MAG: nucleotidyltransferase family protein [Thermoanaerobaculia bacterium]